MLFGRQSLRLYSLNDLKYFPTGKCFLEYYPSSEESSQASYSKYLE